MNSKIQHVVYFTIYLILLTGPITGCGETEMDMNNVSKVNDFLVVDGSQINNKVILIEYGSESHIISKEVLRDSQFLNCNINGDFLYKSKSNSWSYGNIKKSQSAIDIKSVPEGVTYAELSTDCKKILWCVQSEQTSSIVMSGLDNGGQTVLVSKQGIIRVPAWSPDSQSIAYYYGRPDVVATGEFTLELIKLPVKGSEVKQIAPSSQPTGLTADRAYPPLWSTDGERILFCANYEIDNVIKSKAYTVKTDGTGLQSVEGGVWSSDGKYILGVRRTYLPFGPFILSIYDPSTQQFRNIDLPLNLPMSLANGRWKPDGKKFVFITDDNEVTLIDIDNKKKVKLIDFIEGANIIWLD